MGLTAVFDIGKTNKKCFLFDEQLNEIHKEYTRIDEITDDDGYPCDNLEAITHWLRQTLDGFILSGHPIEGVNFSTYGATLVHLDKEGKPLTPLYNYLKDYPDDLLEQFKSTYGNPSVISGATSSPQFNMLNSGLQLYWLKHRKPELFKKIRYSLHFPQYLSFIFTGEICSEYTSVGCHTMLWDFNKNDYHEWVYSEGIDKILAPLIPTDKIFHKKYAQRDIKIGPGIHDSSAALLPYLSVNDEPFILLSTGTWNIALNPFINEPLLVDHLQQDCLNFLRPDGQPVRAARLFLGHEYNLQIKNICEHFNLNAGADKNLKFLNHIYSSLKRNYQRKFHFKSLSNVKDQPRETNLDQFTSFEEAYHQLMMEFMEIQAVSIRLAAGNSKVTRIYVDGGFADNEIFIELLSREFKAANVLKTSSPLGSALGAALMVTNNNLCNQFFHKHFIEKLSPTS